MKEERELVTLARGGDEAAFGSLLEALEPSLKRVLSGILRGRPEVDLEDALQEVRIYLHSRLDRYNPEYPFAVFARALARTIGKRLLYQRSDLAGPQNPEEESGGCELSPMELEKLPLSLRAVGGEGRFTAPDEVGRQPTREFLEVFEMLLAHGGYPHQQIAFGFSILVWGKRKKETRSTTARSQKDKVPVTGDPARVGDKIGPLPLSGGFERLVRSLREEIRFDEAYLERVSRPVRERLEILVRELFAKDIVSHRLFKGMAQRVVGETKLEEYCGKDPRRSISDWTRSVKERIRKVYLDPKSAIQKVSA